MTNARVAASGLAVLLAVTAAGGLEAQVGGLIKKKAARLAGAASAGEPVAFDDATLELTPDRIARVVAAKATARRLMVAPDGPNAIRQRLDGLEERQSKIYETQADAINAWDERRRDSERCLDSVLVVFRNRLTGNQAEFMQRMTPLAFRMAQAQQRGDTAEMRRVQEDMRRAVEPSPADSARARQACPVPPPPPQVQEWTRLKSEAEKAQQELQRAEQAVRDAEQKASGMNQRQLGIACERILLYLERARAKRPQTGFTSEELATLEAAIKELQGACA